jgi:hypothetical protein
MHIQERRIKLRESGIIGSGQKGQKCARNLTERFSKMSYYMASICFDESPNLIGC